MATMGICRGCCASDKTCFESQCSWGFSFMLYLSDPFALERFGLWVQARLAIPVPQHTPYGAVPVICPNGGACRCSIGLHQHIW